MAQILNQEMTDPNGKRIYVSGASQQDVNNTINSSSLSSQKPIDLTQSQSSVSPYTSLFGGGNSIIGANDSALSTAPIDVKKETPSDLMSQIQGLLAPPKPQVSQSDLTLGSDKAASAEQNAIVAQQAEQNSRDKYNALNAQLQQYQYNASTLIPAAIQENATGRGITAGGLAPIQAAELRKNALAAAPVQFNALIAQAELASAQGRTALAQGVLQQANSHLDKMYELQQQDVQTQYNYQKDIFNKVWDYANASEKRTLDAIALKKEQDFSLQRDKINNDYAQQKMLLQQKIDAQDPLKQAELRKTNAEIANINSQISERNRASAGEPTSYKSELATTGRQAVFEMINTAQANPGIFGKTAALPLPDFVRSDAFRNYKAQVDYLKGNIIPAALTAMREASKTGGALGQVSDREGAWLGASIGALDMAQSPEQVVKQLKQIDQHLANWQSAVAQYGGGGFTVTAPNGDRVQIID